ELRLRNIVREGDEGPTGQILTAVGLEECLLRAADAIGWKERRPGPGRGKGIACGWWTTTGGSSGVYVKINPDGTVALNTGAVEIGTGALTGAAQVLAEELGVDLTDINVVSADTFSTPFDFGAQGSRTAFAVGNACRAAAADLRRVLFAQAALLLGVSEDALALRDKHVVGPEGRVSLADLARQSQIAGGGMIAHGTFIAPGTAYDTKRVEGHAYPAFHSPSFHAHAVDLSVDEDTGEVTIHKYVVAQDVGFALNPTYIEGQIEGGVAQGLGQTLSEEIVYREGRVLNANLTDYKMPTALDVPRIQSIIVEHPGLIGPYGAKGVGEPPNVEPPATVANAIAAAIGVRVASLPITAEKIVMALTTGLLLLPSHPAGRLAEIAQLAERTGYDYLWLADERFFREVYASLTFCALRTQRITLGPCVTDPYSRHPALTAMAIATLDELSGRRAVLGLGAGVSGFRELGIARDKPGVGLREAVDVIRQLLAGETVTYPGSVVRVDGAHLDFKPVRAEIPMYIASQRPVGVRAAGRVADGAIMQGCVAEPLFTFFRDTVIAGAREADRDPARIDLVARINVCVHDDRKVARDLMKPTIVRSLAAQRPDYFTFATAGLTVPPALAKHLETLTYAYDPRPYLAAAADVPESFVDAVTLAGPPDEVAAGVVRLARLGATQLMMYPVAPE